MEQVSDTGSTGYLFSQPIVADNSGKELRLDDLLGPGFALVSRNRNIELSEKSRRILEEIGANVVCIDGLKEVKGHFDRSFKHSETVLVRPDKLVFGHTSDNINADQLIEELGRSLALTILGTGN
jgi:hypothetical protein